MAALRRRFATTNVLNFILSRTKSLVGSDGTVSRASSAFATRDEIFRDVMKLRQEAKDYRPSKLLMVYRTHNMIGIPRKEREVIIQLGLDEKMYKPVIVKNTPSICNYLTKVKHLIRVKPVTFPNGPPTEDNYTGTLLKQNGEFVVSSKLKVDPQLLVEDERTKRFAMNKITLWTELRRKWHT